MAELSFSLPELWAENVKGGAEHPPDRIGLRREGALIGPSWPSAPFWLLLYKSKYQRYSYVHDIVFIEQPNEFSQVGNYKGSLVGLSKFKATFLWLD